MKTSGGMKHVIANPGALQTFKWKDCRGHCKVRLAAEKRTGGEQENQKASISELTNLVPLPPSAGQGRE